MDLTGLAIALASGAVALWVGRALCSALFCPLSPASSGPNGGSGDQVSCTAATMFMKDKNFKNRLKETTECSTMSGKDREEFFKSVQELAKEGKGAILVDLADIQLTDADMAKLTIGFGSVAAPSAGPKAQDSAPATGPEKSKKGPDVPEHPANTSHGVSPEASQEPTGNAEGHSKGPEIAEWVNPFKGARAGTDWKGIRNRGNRSKSRSRSSRSRNSDKGSTPGAKRQSPSSLMPAEFFNEGFDYFLDEDGFYTIPSNLRDQIDRMLPDGSGAACPGDLSQAHLEAISTLWMADVWAHLGATEGLDDLRFFVKMIPRAWSHNTRRRLIPIAGANLQCLLALGLIASNGWVSGGDTFELLTERLCSLPEECVNIGGQDIGPGVSATDRSDAIVSTMGVLKKQLVERQKGIESKIEELATSVLKLTSVLSGTLLPGSQACPEPSGSSRASAASVAPSLAGITKKPMPSAQNQPNSTFGWGGSKPFTPPSKPLSLKPSKKPAERSGLFKNY